MVRSMMSKCHYTTTFLCVTSITGTMDTMDLRLLPINLQKSIVDLLSTRDVASVARTSKDMYALMARNRKTVDVTDVVRRALHTAVNLMDDLWRVHDASRWRDFPNTSTRKDWQRERIIPVLKRRKFIEYVHGPNWVEVRRVYESDARTQIEAHAFYSFLAPPKATIFVTHGSVSGQLSGLGDLRRHHLASTNRPPHITVSLWKNPHVLSLWNTRVRKATAERYKLDAVHVGTVLYRALIPYQRFCSIEIYVQGVERPGVSFNRLNAERNEIKRSVISENVRSKNANAQRAISMLSIGNGPRRSKRVKLR